MVLLLDIGKGGAAVLFAGGADAGATTTAAVGFSAVLGHVYPVWLKFKGGKGVATAFGAFTILAPLAAVLAAALFALAVWTTRYVSVGSILAATALSPLVFFTSGGGPVLASALGAGTLVLLRHRSNLARLQMGSEHRLAVRG
jgi:glycerol-3-phosphate acyltransferase PlsY